MEWVGDYPEIVRGEGGAHSEERCAMVREPSTGVKEDTPVIVTSAINLGEENVKSCVT